jgi:hypothetical protein
MSGTRWSLLLILAAVGLTGCQTGPSKQTLAASEPALSPPVEGGTSVVAVPSPRTVTFVDRHPLFSKPRDYYESSGNNAVVKTAAAVVVGVPVGFVGEIRQIVVGTPAASAPTIQ